MKSILLIIPYFGKWPIWFDAYLISIASNKTINWLIVTDCKVPKEYPKNIKFATTTLADLNSKVNSIVEANVFLTPRKFCDLKPAYGEIFSQEIIDYDFWGICDMDIIWGDIRKFITPQLLDQYDIISTLEDMVSGHFTLFRNTKKINSLYKGVKNYKFLFEQPKFMWFDERIFTTFLQEVENSEIKIFWNYEQLKKGIKSEVHQQYYLDRWFYENGVLKDLYSSECKEYMYLHFINWKKTMKRCDVTYIDNNVEKFYISYSGIHFNKHSNFAIVFNDFTNLFDGYFVRLWWHYKKIYLKRILSKFKKRI